MKKAVEAGQPFYLNMAHYAVHNPFETDKRFIEHYRQGGKSGQAQGFATLIEGMDKSLGKARAAELLSDLVERAPGAPTIAPESDKRPTYDRTAEFENLEKGE